MYNLGVLQFVVANINTASRLRLENTPPGLPTLENEKPKALKECYIWGSKGTPPELF